MPAHACMTAGPPDVADDMECVAIRRPDGRVGLLIERTSVPEAFEAFADAATAMRTAFRLGPDARSRLAKDRLPVTS